mmetsp:Transcript_35378/g.76511  ORF Transcript_35378/g.76511 Transcript_35378/m.76511 type:complete len:106 (-) Transcript_35378:6-323(-)
MTHQAGPLQIFGEAGARQRCLDHRMHSNSSLIRPGFEQTLFRLEVEHHCGGLGHRGAASDEVVRLRRSSCHLVLMAWRVVKDRESLHSHKFVNCKALEMRRRAMP